MEYLEKLCLPIGIETADPQHEEGKTWTTRMKVKDLPQFMKRWCIEYFYNRNDILKGGVVCAPEDTWGRGTAGLDVYVCRRCGKPPKTPKIIRNTTSLKRGCLARFTVNFERGYRHAEGDLINVKEFGETKTVKIRWKSHHSHPFNNFEECAADTLSSRARHLLGMAFERGMTFKDVKEMQRKHAGGLFLEIHKIKDYNAWYICRTKLENPAVRDKAIETSLKTHANAIAEAGGFAEFTDEFNTLGGDHEMRGTQTKKGAKVWSFWFMTSWQHLLMRRCTGPFHLHVSHESCHGLVRTDLTKLYAVIVKNEVTGAEAPVAFMLSNSQTDYVISGFLRSVKSCVSFNPSEAVTNCDHAGISAVETVLEIPVVWSRSQVTQSFKSTIEESHFGGNLAIEEAISDFNKVARSRNASEAEANIKQFEHRYRYHPDFMKYMHSQWFNCKNYFIDAYNGNFPLEQSTDKLVDSYQRKLQWECLQKCTEQRPDVLVHQLISLLLPEYKGMEWRTTQTLVARNDEEKMAQSKSAHLLKDQIFSMVVQCGNGIFNVDSFEVEGKLYRVNLEYAGLDETMCQCPVHQNNGLWCKHMFLMKRWWDNTTLSHDSNGKATTPSSVSNNVNSNDHREEPNYPNNDLDCSDGIDEASRSGTPESLHNSSLHSKLPVNYQFVQYELSQGETQSGDVSVGDIDDDLIDSLDEDLDCFYSELVQSNDHLQNSVSRGHQNTEEQMEKALHESIKLFINNLKALIRKNKMLGSLESQSRNLNKYNDQLEKFQRELDGSSPEQVSKRRKV